MQTRSTLDGDDGRLPILPLRVFRLDDGTSYHVRFLSQRYFGLFVHWTRGRSVYCDPEGCPHSVHQTDRFWKGYAACEVYDGPRKLWFPCVLEITEHLELDLRDQYARGQVWFLERQRVEGKKKSPTKGRFVEQLDLKTLPLAFDFVPVLLHLYHRPKLDLTAKNPMPPRLMIAASSGAPPSTLEPASTKDSDEKMGRISMVDAYRAKHASSKNGDKV